MTTRYCGVLKIDIKLAEYADAYTCRISRFSKPISTQIVGASQEQIHKGLLEKPATFDSVAHAALSFADDEGADLDGANMNDTGWLIRRKK